MLKCLFIVAALAFSTTANAASRFWVGGTAIWDGSTTTHWSATTGGAGGSSVPASGDDVTFDASSGGGTVTVAATINGSNTIQSITMGAFGGTLDFSANNPNVTMNTFNGSGSGTRTINLGSGTFTLVGTTGFIWDFSTVTGLTFNAGTSTVLFSATPTATRTIILGGKTFSTVSIAGWNNAFAIVMGSGGGGASGTIGTFNLTAPAQLFFGYNTTHTITNAFNLAGTSTNQLFFSCEIDTLSSTISVATGSPTISWAGLRGMNFSGGATFTATNSFDFKANTGITITPPAAGGGGGRIIGG